MSAGSFARAVEALEKKDKERRDREYKERLAALAAERQEKEAAWAAIEEAEIARLGISRELFALLKEFIPAYRDGLAKLVPAQAEAKAGLGTEELALRKMMVEHPTVHQQRADAMAVVGDEDVRSIVREQ